MAPIPNTRVLNEAEETLHAIRSGAVDAFVVEEPEGHFVYALERADLPYSTLVERMQQGAAMLDTRCQIIYCNQSLANLLGIPRETVIGTSLQRFLAEKDHDSCEKLLQDAQIGRTEGEMALCRADGTLISASFSFQVLSRDKTTVGVLITDLTAQKEQADLASRLQRVQDDERRNIARELHDSVGQLLAAIGMNIAAVQEEAEKLGSAAALRVADTAGLVDQVSKEIRTISYLLHPPLLEIAGLVCAIRWYVDGFSARSNIKVDLDLPDDFARLPDDVEIAIFRIIQECLTNVHRHSGSTTARIRIAQQDGVLHLEVQDHGRGITAEKLGKLAASSGRAGVGVGGMRERVKQLGGTLEVQSAETGTMVRATIKLP